ncbi:WD40-repeat-containing domain protein [Pavlovales sp. CCMP2436]|nr:WD40-repeat-containing domain protein [Pavlovales sp. CCMP2436]
MSSPWEGTGEARLRHGRTTQSASTMVGHTAPVVHLQANPHAGAHDLASAGEDGWVRLWDLRASRSTRALGKPRVAGQPAEAQAASCVCHSAQDANVVFAAWSDVVCAFDLRAGGVLLRDATASFEGGSEEVNSLAASVDGSALLGGDDSGALLVWDPRSSKRRTRVADAHTSVLSMVVSHPRHALRAYSAGLDGRICAWSLPADGKVGKGGLRPTWECSLLAEAAASAAGGSNQLLNPRLAHAIAIDASGDLLAAALGDGSVELRCASTGQQLARAADEDAHRGSACQVGFLPAAGADAGLLWSAGNDKLLRIWSIATAAQKASGAKGGSKQVPTRELRPAFDVRLPHKPNWVTEVATSKVALCVADVDSGTLAVYDLRDL